MPEIPDSRIDEELNRTDLEAPAGTQATHAADIDSDAALSPDLERTHTARDRVAERVDRVGDTLARQALELELKGGLKAKAAPAIRRASRAADASASYVREKDIDAMRGDLENTIREHPLRSIAIALGAGYILARLLD